MAKNDQKVWGAILPLIKKELPNSAYKAWFLGTKSINFEPENQTLTLGVKNTFIKEQLLKRYETHITSCAKKAGYANLKLKLTISKNQEQIPAEPIFSGRPLSTLSQKIRPYSLNPNHTFDNFVVGLTNNIAYLAAKQVAQAPSKNYNPLFLYGPTGVGKTHLLHAVGNDTQSRFLDVNVLYQTAEGFMNNFIESLQNKTQQGFRSKFRKADVLLLDDIHFFAGKESTQDEFFHTLNELLLSSKQVVVASDRHPKELGKIKERLISRFLGGMVADISYPDLETKTAILKLKCSERGINLEAEALLTVARNCHGGARELEGVITQVLAHLKLTGQSPSVENIAAIIKKAGSQKPQPTPEKIISAVCAHLNLSERQVKSTSRKAKYVFARQIAMYLLRQDAGLSLALIGDLVGGKDHTTVLYGIEKVGKDLINSASLSDEVLRIRSLFHRN